MSTLDGLTSSPQNKSANITKSPTPLCIVGSQKVNSNVSAPLKKENDCTPKTQSANNSVSNIVTLKRKRLKEDIPFATLAFHPPTKKKISSVSAPDCLSSIQIPKSSKMSQVDSIGNAKVFSNFWTKSTRTLSTKSWLPTKIDLVDTELTSWNGYSANTMSNSWFSAQIQQKQDMMKMNSRMMSCQSSPISWQRTMDNDLGSPDEIISKSAIPKKSYITKKIRIFPNPKQKQVLNEWFGAARWTYNRCVEEYRKTKKKISRKDYRDKFINKGNPPEFLLQTPFEIRDHTLLELESAIQGNVTNKKNGNIEKYEMKFRSRKWSRQESIYIRSRSYKNGAFYVRFFGKEPVKSSEPLPETLYADSNLIRTELGEYYMCVVEPTKEMVFLDESQVPKNKIASLDPGVRTFQTIYDPDGQVLHAGKNDIARIYRLCKTHDEKQSQLSSKELRKKGRYKLKRSMKKLRKKLRDLVKDMHCKLTKFLVVNYNEILLPSFETSQMLTKKSGKRKINSKTARNMACWSHYKFKQRLQFKASQTSWCKVRIVDESYTSKTCGNCGVLKHNLGGAKLFKCNHCGVRIDRDVNGARNIYLKNKSL